ncbi:hypothetical protein OQA88_9235 [Cercophora sp. LCS_1]
MDSPPSESDPSPGPKIFRPIPRRPFNLNFTSATPPEEDSAPATPHISANDLRFLDPRYQKQQHDQADSLSRATSFMNLTQSTLFGIYDADRDDNTPTPWGTGAETPATLNVDAATSRLMKERLRRVPSQPPPTPTRLSVLASLILRASLLFGLGMGYGVLVTRLPTTGTHPEPPPTTTTSYLFLWGFAGVILGCLLPWFDRFWEETFHRRANNTTSANPKRAEEEKNNNAPEADWALVVRGVGAFVGIVFAIRKLPWTSTMQVSLTLALANPFLWYLIDRSKPGFLLSAAVGVAGSAVMMGWNPDVMPAPTGLLSSSSHSGMYNNGTSYEGDNIVLGGLARLETVETGIWMLSVLFCSCVCFGNIGRRLALNGAASTRGRWGGVR